MHTCSDDFERFIRERTYLHNVSARTIDWYRESFKWLRQFPLTDDGLKQFVIAMREKGLKPVSCNNRIRVANAFLHWAGLPLKIDRLKEEQKVLPTFTPEAVRAILTWKPKTHTHHRLYALISTLLDTGMRIDEALELHRADCNFDDLLLVVHGKGNKQRQVPMSVEGRRTLYRFCQRHEHERVFCTRDGGKLGRRDVLRDLKMLCRRLQFEPPERTLHALRHTFALNYIRRGGSQFHLMKILGHTSLEMTRKYVNLQTADLQAVHDGLSPLARRR